MLYYKFKDLLTYGVAQDMVESLTLDIEEVASQQVPVTSVCLRRQPSETAVGQCQFRKNPDDGACDIAISRSVPGYSTQEGACTRDFDEQARCAAIYKRAAELVLDAAEEAEVNLPVIDCDF